MRFPTLVKVLVIILPKGSDSEVVLANGNLTLPAASAAWVAIR